MSSLSHGTRGPLVQRADTLTVAPGLSCSAAHEFSVPRTGVKPASPALEDGFSTTGPPVGHGSVQFSHSVMSDSLRPHEP